MIVVDAAVCSGCGRCEVNCAFFHSGRVGRAGARVKVVRIESIGIDYPVYCQQCQERYCTHCPQHAIEIGPLGQIIVSPTLCVSCGACEKLCPIGAIELYRGIAHVCDLCGGRPQCVPQCPMNAIGFVPDEIESVSLKPFKRGSGRLTPEQKRVRFAENRTQSLRQKWMKTG